MTREYYPYSIVRHNDSETTVSRPSAPSEAIHQPLRIGRAEMWAIICGSGPKWRSENEDVEQGVAGCAGVKEEVSAAQEDRLSSCAR
jgi:hypothetical protein